VADGAFGLQLINIAAVFPPTLDGTTDTPDFAVDVDIAGDHAYVADGSSGLQVIDITDPTLPTLAGSYNTPNIASGVQVAGDHAYVADQTSGLLIINITNPASPTLNGTYNTPSSARGVAISGDHAYIADLSSGLQVIDISDPSLPTLAGSFNTSGLALGVAVAGNHAYVADDAAGLQVIDISNPALPTLAGTYNTPSAALGVAIAGDHAYVADNSSGLQVIDITNPTAPTLTGTYDTPGQAEGIAVFGDRAYVADGAGGGLQVIDISVPALPTLAGTYDTPGAARGVAVTGDHAFLGDGFSGLQVIRAYQRAFDLVNNRGQSLNVNTSAETIPAVRVTSTQQGIVSWELTADGGAAWTSVPADGSWQSLIVPGSDLRWRSTHDWSGSSVNSSVSQLEIEWRFEFAPIDSIVDVPSDQGGWAYLHFRRSGYDLATEANFPIAAYNIHRRVDDAALAADIMTHGELLAPTTPSREDAQETSEPLRPFVPVDGGEVLQLGGDYFWVPPMRDSSEPPPGVWAIVATVLAQQQDKYIALVPTVGDSSAAIPFSVYYVSAHSTTPSVFFESPPDSGYSVDNIAPAVPTSFQIAGAQLTWDPSPDEDFQYFTIYGSNSDDLGSATQIGFALEPTFDVSTAPHPWYLVTASDYVGNESAPASVTDPAVSAPPRDPIPAVFSLGAGMPTPFRGSTTISFGLPERTHAKITILDVRGRLVRKLVHEELPPGTYQKTWLGEDDAGRAVSPGVYFFLMEAGDFRKSNKTLFLR
jgi:hypothetical protein